LVLVKTQMTKYGIITLQNFTQIQSYVAYFLLYISASLIVILLYLIFDNSWNSLIIIGIYLLGISSRIILAFSPTIWASGERTYAFMFISLIICNIMMFQQIVKVNLLKFSKYFIIFIGTLATMSYLNLLLSF
jgi:hypothetical protein